MAGPEARISSLTLRAAPTARADVRRADGRGRASHSAIDAAIVLVAGLGRAVLAEVDVAAVEPDDGLVLGLVVAVGGECGASAGMVRLLGVRKVVLVPLSEDFRAALPTAGRYTQLVFGEGLEIRVGDGIRTRDIQIHNLVP